MRELALHILDIAQNSLQAGATRIEIEIAEDLASDLLCISITDDGRGMDEDLLARVLDPFVTTRKTRRMGLGLPLFAAAAERCKGSLRIESAPGRGTKVTAAFQHSHIDRAPLGDSVSTLLAILLAEERVDIVYRHRVNDRAFSFDSAEIRGEIGDIPLSFGPVMQWLREYLTENLDALQSAQ